MQMTKPQAQFFGLSIDNEYLLSFIVGTAARFPTTKVLVVTENARIAHNMESQMYAASHAGKEFIPFDSPYVHWNAAIMSNIQQKKHLSAITTVNNESCKNWRGGWNDIVMLVFHDHDSNNEPNLRFDRTNKYVTKMMELLIEMANPQEITRLPFFVLLFDYNRGVSVRQCVYDAEIKKVYEVILCPYTALREVVPQCVMEMDFILAQESVPELQTRMIELAI